MHCFIGERTDYHSDCKREHVIWYHRFYFTDQNCLLLPATTQLQFSKSGRFWFIMWSIHQVHWRDFIFAVIFTVDKHCSPFFKSNNCCDIRVILCQVQGSFVALILSQISNADLLKVSGDCVNFHLLCLWSIGFFVDFCYFLPQKIANCLALLPMSRVDGDSWSHMIQKIIIEINTLLTDYFQGVKGTRIKCLFFC